MTARAPTAASATSTPALVRTAPLQPIVVEHVSKSYRLGHVTVQALADVSLSVAPGEFLAIAGPSGSGKTTLLNLLGALDRPDTGRIAVAGTDLGSLGQGQLADLRARAMGFVFQTFNLIPVLSAYENVEYPLLLHPRPGNRRQRIERALEQVGLSDRARHRPSELSGGQQQRVAIARALVGDPSIVLADEPTANLDSRTGEEIIALMHELSRACGTTFVFSTHDPRIMRAADRVVEISDGALRPPSTSSHHHEASTWVSN